MHLHLIHLFTFIFTIGAIVRNNNNVETNSLLAVDEDDDPIVPTN